MTCRSTQVMESLGPTEDWLLPCGLWWQPLQRRAGESLSPQRASGEAGCWANSLERVWQ